MSDFITKIIEDNIIFEGLTYQIYILLLFDYQNKNYLNGFETIFRQMNMSTILFSIHFVMSDFTQRLFKNIKKKNDSA